MLRSCARRSEARLSEVGTLIDPVVEGCSSSDCLITDHILQVYDSMTQVTSNLNQALSKAVNRSASHLNHQRTYAEALQSVQKDLHENLVKTGMAAAKTISRLVDEFELSAARMLNKIASAGETADAQYAGLAHVSNLCIPVVGDRGLTHAQKLRSTHDGVDAYQERVGKVFQEVIRGSSELAARQTSEWEANHRLAADVAAMLRRMNEQEIHKAVMGLKGVVTQMVIRLLMVMLIYNPCLREGV